MSKEIPIDQLFKELDENIQNSQYKKAIRVCNKILTINGADVEAYHCKLICLMQLNQFNETIELIKTPEQIETYSFERIYCLYALGKYQESVNELNNLKQKSNKILELEAQVYYKLENYQKTISIYEGLSNQSGYSDSVEFITNLCAVYIDAGKSKECQELLNKNKSNLNKTYEFAFNSSCYLISKGDIKGAESQLKVAKKVCIDSLKKDGFSEEEIQDELSAVDVQLAYCQQLLGGSNKETAIKTYEAVIEKKQEDSATMVALNNYVSLKSSNTDEHKELVQYLDQIKSIFENETKLNTQQKKCVHLNHCFLLLQLKRVQQCEDQIKLIKTKSSSIYSEISKDLVLIEATLLSKEKKWKEAETLLSKSQNDLKAKVLLAQIYLMEGDVKKCLGVFETLDDSFKNKPAVISTMVALYEKSGDIEKAITSLDSMIQSLSIKKSKSEQEEESYLNLLKVSGNFKMKHHKYKEAADMYEKVLKLNSNDLVALPSYIIATSHFDPTLSQKYESKLPTIKFDNKVDIDLIEKYGLSWETRSKSTTTPTMTPKSTTKPTTTTTTKPITTLLKKKKKTSTKPKKVYTTELDPERWLPKWQRAAARNARSNKGGKGKKVDQIMRGPQGVSSAEQSAQLFKSGINTTTTPVVSNVTPQKTEKAKNAHKKKGGKK